MQDVPTIPELELFMAYAQENPRRWQAAVGQAVTHTRFGVGTIKSTDGSYIEIHFIDDKTSRKFKCESLANANFFSNVKLPTNLEGMEKTKERLLKKLHQEVQQRLENEKRVAEENHQREEAQKQKALMQQRLEEQRKKEQVTANEFLNLKNKYCAHSYRSTSPSSDLYPILICIDARENLHSSQIEWLENTRLFDTLAIYFQNEYQKIKDPWKLVRASGYLRDASNPGKAIELTNYLLANHSSANSKVKSAILTTRGGAFRDLQDLSMAEQCAKDAIKHQESFQPYNLLGAIYFERGEPVQGEACFLRALELGAQSTIQVAQMRNALKNAEHSKQSVVAQFLLQRDPAKYQWAAYYLEKSHASASE